MAIGGADSVHSDLREAVVDVSSDEDGPPAHRVHRVIHQRVVTCKLNHIVWETLCRLKTAKRLTGTLKEENKHKIKDKNPLVSPVLTLVLRSDDVAFKTALQFKSKQLGILAAVAGSHHMVDW